MGKQDRIYDRFATVYDKLKADTHSRQMVEYCRKIFGKYDIHPERGLDLCCGTGTALQLFSEMGIQMTGLDQSPAMLKVARRKTKEFGVKLHRQELPRFLIRQPGTKRTPQQFDLVTSFYDSLNYLTTERKLQTAFKAVNRHLAPGGWFIFDMNTPEALRFIWDSHVWGGTKDDLAWIWENDYYPDKRMASCTTTFFFKKGRSWERYVETHWEKGYLNSTIRRLLEESGFIVRGIFNCLEFRPATKSSYRICAVARKRQR